METVNVFNSELCSLYNMKPPISKTKMVELTKLAMKAAKFYKHVVQSIEKFIHKCQPEFKIPGLYVIDSIVRQSRHQFGADKDLFSQRFSKNIAMTFHNLLTCPSQDICKIVRVLNLWQKNNVFPPTIIQPLLDMAADPLNVNVYLTAQRSVQRVTGVAPSVPQPASASAATMSRTRPSASSALLDLDLSATDSQNELFKNLSQLLQQAQQPVFPLINPQQLQLHLMQQQLLQHLQLQQQPEPQLQIDSNLMAQIQALTASLMSRLGSGVGGSAGSVTSEELVSTMEPSPVINKKFADVSYTESDLDDDRRDVHSCSSLSHVSALPLEHGHNRKHKVSGPHPSASGHSSKLWSPEEREASLTYDRDNDQSHDDISDIVTPRSGQPRPLAVGSEDVFVSPPASSLQQLQSTPCEDEVQEDRKAPRDFSRRGWKRDSDHDGWDREKDEWKRSGLRRLDSDDRQARRGSRDRQEGSGREDSREEEFFRDRSSSSRLDYHALKSHDQEPDIRRGKVAAKDLPPVKERYRSSANVVEPDWKPARRRSRSRSPSRNSHRSRSRSRSRDVTVDKKKHSRSPDHKRCRPSEPEKDISRWECILEHPRLGLPPIKEQHACICSVTLWIGNVSKQLKEETLRAEVAKFGKASVDLIPQRGCAFACFDTRQEASKALQGLNDLKLLDKNLKVTWAPNIGIKESEFKGRWDVDLGVTYIPWDRLPQSLDAIAVGAVVDEESLPEHMKNLDEAGVQDDLTTSNEVTSSTDCQPDGQPPRSLPPSASTPPTSNPALQLTAPASVLPSETSVVLDQVFEGTDTLASSLKSPVASLAPDVADNANDLSVSNNVSGVPPETGTTFAATSAACSQLVQGIQNILNSTAAASATQAIPGIITPGIVPPSTSTSDSLFSPLPGMWPSICGFNPLVPPPGFLATFDPTRPPPSLGPQSVAGDLPVSQEKAVEENSGAENTSDNMDLDESVSSSQGDDQDFLESRIELIQSGSLPSGTEFVEAQQTSIHSGTGWNPGTVYSKRETKAGVDYSKAPSSRSATKGLDKRSAEEGSSTNSTMVETNPPASSSATDVSSMQGWNLRDEGRGISSGSIAPVASSTATSFSCPISGTPPTESMTFPPGLGPVPQGQSSGAVTLQPLHSQSSCFAGVLPGNDLSHSGPNMGVMPPVILSGPGSRLFSPGSMPGAPSHLVRPGPVFGGPNASFSGPNDESSGPNASGNPGAIPFAPNGFAGQSNPWTQRPVDVPNRLPMGSNMPMTRLGFLEAVGRPNAFPPVGPNMPSNEPGGTVPCDSPNTGSAKSSDAGSADKERQARETSRGFPEASNASLGVQGKVSEEILSRGGSQGEPFADLNRMPCGPNGMAGGPFGLPTRPDQMSDNPSPMPFGPDRIPFGPDGPSRMPIISDSPGRLPSGPEASFRMPGAPGDLNRFLPGPDVSNQVPGRQDHQNRMPVMSDEQNRMQFAPNGNQSGTLCGPNRMPNGSNRMPSGPDGMQGASFGVPGGPSRMPFGPNRMPNGPDRMQGGMFGIPVDTNRMPFGPNRMSVGIDGPNRMPFVPDGLNRMPFVPDGQNRMPFVPDGQNRIPGGQAGMQSGPFGMTVGSNRMSDPNQMSGQNQMLGMIRIPNPNQMPAASERSVNEMFGEKEESQVSRTGLSSFPGGIPQGSQVGLAPSGGPPGQLFPAVPPPGIGKVPGPCSSQGTVPSGSGMAYSSQDGGPSGSCKQPSGHSRGASSEQGNTHLAQAGMGPGPGRMPGPGSLALSPSGMPQRHDGMPPRGVGYGPRGMSSGLGGLTPGLDGRFPGPGGMPRGGPGGFPGGPNGMPMVQGGRFPGSGGNAPGQDGMPMSQGGRFPGPGGNPPGQDGMPMSQGGRFSGPGGNLPGQDGMPMSQGGRFPGPGGNPPGQDGMPMSQGGRFPGPGGNPSGQDGMPMSQGGRFPGPGGNPSGQDGMLMGQRGRFLGPSGISGRQDGMHPGQGGRFPGPGGISSDPDGMSAGACRLPTSSSGPPAPDGIFGHPGPSPSTSGAGLNRMPFGFPMTSSSSGGMPGIPGGRIGSFGSGIVFPGSSDTTQQLSNVREQRPGPEDRTDMASNRSCPGSSSSESREPIPFQGPGFSNIRPSGFGEGQQFANSSSSAFDQHSLQASSPNLHGFLENTDKAKASIQRFLAPGLGGGVAFPGLFGSSVVGTDGKTGFDQLGQFGIDSKNAPIPSLFPTFDNIRLASGQLRFPTSDRFFFRPQLDNPQVNDRPLRTDTGNVPKTGRHIRRSDLFPSMKQRGRHPQGNHHRWNDRRRDRRNHGSKDFHDHEDRESHDGCRRSSSKDSLDVGHYRSDQAANDNNSQKLNQMSSGAVSEILNSKTDKEPTNPSNQDTKEPASGPFRSDSFPNASDEKSSS